MDESLRTTPLYISVLRMYLVYFRNVRRGKRSRFGNALLHILFFKLKSASEFGLSESKGFITWAAARCWNARKYRSCSCQFWIWIMHTLWTYFSSTRQPNGDRPFIFIAGTKRSFGDQGKLNVSFSLNQIRSWNSGWKDQLCHLAHGLKFHSFVLLWPDNCMLWVQWAEMA